MHGDSRYVSNKRWYRNCNGAEKSTALHIGKAVVTFTPRPVWPFGTRIRRTTTGVFMLRVRPNGSAARVEIVQSTGYQTTDLASMDVFYK